MNLQDILREQTAPILDLIGGAESEIAEYRRQQESAEQRERQLKHEASEIQPAIAERQQTVRDALLKVQEIERQITDLQERLKQRKEEHGLAEVDSHALQEEAGDKYKEASRERKEVDRWGKKLFEAQERLRSYQARFSAEQQTSFKKYLNALWMRLLESEQEVEDKKESLMALDNLNHARHKDPSVADLWEARQEWQRIERSAGPLAVRQTAGKELKKIEAKLNEQFPGALDITKTGILDELEELFFYSAPSGEGCMLPLPVSKNVHDKLNDGNTGANEQLAVKIIWAFAKSFPRISKKTDINISRFTIQNGMLVMQVDRTATEIRNQDAVVLHLSDKGRVSFMLTELSNDITQAIIHENINS